MSEKIYIGKFGPDRPKQIEEKFYEGGVEGSSWYNGIEVGDYIFPVYNGGIQGLWRVREYRNNYDNEKNGETIGACFFDEVKKFEKAIPINDFNRFKFFDLDLTFLNKISKSTGKSNIGFFQINLLEEGIDINQISIENNLRHVYIVTDKSNIEFKDGDIVIIADKHDGYRVKSIKIIKNSKQEDYDELTNLYKTKNENNYSLLELSTISKNVGNTKHKYIDNIIEKLENESYYEFLSLIKMYDNIFISNGDLNLIESEIKDKDFKIEKFEDGDVLNEVFIDKSRIDDILFNLDYKKNIILQGPPGVGKTFVAKRLCYLHQQKKSKDNIETIQFHQSYSYEDFIRGYRPNKDGGFSLKDGVFYKFVQKAIKDQENNYYFIIDEINRGNLSKIFGELMMLIETDKRGEEHQVSLTYQEDNEKFYIPENLYIIGTMNTADRSLAMVDYALRRRFAFIDLEPAFKNETLVSHFSNYLGNEMTNKIINKITRLNNIIEKETIDLGKGYKIGHSYFTPNKEVNDVNSWYERIIKMEIEPLIREYWFDESEEELQKKVDDLLAD